ncbi:hypothetical protein LTR60_006651, partial [Cryomyces antarcticus]
APPWRKGNVLLAATRWGREVGWDGAVVLHGGPRPCSRHPSPSVASAASGQRGGISDDVWAHVGRFVVCQLGRQDLAGKLRVAPCDGSQEASSAVESQVVRGIWVDARG